MELEFIWRLAHQLDKDTFFEVFSRSYDKRCGTEIYTACSQQSIGWWILIRL